MLHAKDFEMFSLKGLYGLRKLSDPLKPPLDKLQNAWRLILYQPPAACILLGGGGTTEAHKTCCLCVRYL